MKLRGELILVAILLGSGVSAWAQFSEVEVTLTPTARQYCHLVSLPQAWVIPRTEGKNERPPFGSDFSEYEFRIQGLQGTEFMVGAFTEYLPPRVYATNQFKLDLSDPGAPIRKATREEWDSGTRVPLTRRSVLVPGQVVPNEKVVDFHGFHFTRSGEIWGQPSEDATRLSPDQAWLILQSSTGKESGPSTKVYYDVFSADTGRKVITIEGTFSTFGGDVDHALSNSGWLTERYIIVPLGKRLEKFMVCEFGGHARQNN